MEGRKPSTGSVLELVTAVSTGAGFRWHLLRSNVECASELLAGRAAEEGIRAPAVISHYENHQKFNKGTQQDHKPETRHSVRVGEGFPEDSENCGSALQQGSVGHLQMRVRAPS